MELTIFAESITTVGLLNGVLRIELERGGVEGESVACGTLLVPMSQVEKLSQDLGGMHEKLMKASSERLAAQSPSEGPQAPEAAH